MKNLLTSILFLITFTTWAQINTNTRQIRFFPVVTAADTTAQASYDGRMWYDFVTDEFRGIRNGTAFSFGAGGGTYTAGSGLTLTGSAFSWGGTLTGATTIAQDGFSTTFTGTGKVSFSPSATLSGLNAGTLAGNPSAPTNGDIWNNTSTGTLNTYVSGQLNRLIGAIGAGLTAGRVPFTAGGSTAILQDDSGLTFSTTNDVLTSGSFAALTTATTAPFNISGANANPSGSTDGSFWYRNDLDKFMGQQNSLVGGFINEASSTWDFGTSSLGGTTRTLAAIGTSADLDIIFQNKGGNRRFFFNTTSGNAIISPGGSATGLVIEGGSGSTVTIGSNSTNSGAQITGGTTNITLSPQSTLDLTITTVGANSDLILETTSAATSTLKLNDGANEQMGVATLVGGTVTVNNTKVTANTRIFLTSQADGGTPGFLRISARSAGTSFTITSSSGTDTSSVAWILFEPN